ncbi:uncharacterized protein DNG_02995 [Cephalotrichum gorgonifer]|uniref:Pyridoxamine 5'-phosphate oxidase Alr4036 family FMN-binding domain-containing protein n=1 Tax=Cephalotrichum gorgonifer TaxID=2041049 RepID=A0AAE8MVH5_9PEZI|nr:uncharacterized protein DNG_02995 [Cephalotrichum gorgonifer]
MSSAAASAPAPWRAEFLSHLARLESPLCALSTVRPATGPSSLATPRVRTVVFRGMWGSLAENPKNPAPRNPPVFESDHLTITTDARMDKAGEIAPSLLSLEEGDAPSDTPGTDGGGAYEAVFWVPDVMTQWRLSGKAYLLGPDVESDDPRAVRVREAVSRGVRTVGEGTFSWEREVTAHFGNLSPGMRGTFRNPPPGRPVGEGAGGEGLGLGQTVEDLHDEIARKNFRVVVLVPDDVDKVDLSDPERATRWRFRYVGDDDGWDTTELWP